MPYFFIDHYYIVLVLPALIFSMWAQYKVKSTFSKYSKMPNSRGMTGEMAAQTVLRNSNVPSVTIEGVKGELTDHYDPKKNTIRLSESVYLTPSIASVGVAAHEAGHAVQYAENYGPIKFRNLIVPVTNIGSSLAVPLVILGLLFSFTPLAMAGVLCFFLAVVFQLVTLPVEFNASRRAIAALESTHALNDDELKGAKKVLDAAALTYVAALAVSLANFLRLFMMVNRNKRR